jgi:hypothetical protein
MTSKDELRRTLQNIKSLAQEGYKQGNFYRFEDILEEIDKIT